MAFAPSDFSRSASGRSVHDSDHYAGMTRSLLCMVRSTDWYTSSDLKDAFFQCSVAVRHRKYLRFCLQGECYQYTCLPFSYSLSPITFSQCVKSALGVLLRKGLLMAWYLVSALVSEIPGISKTPHSGVDEIYQLEEERPLALVPSDLSRSASGRGVHDCDHYAGTVGSDRGDTGTVRSRLQNTVRVDQETLEAPVFCTPGGPAWVVVHEMSTTVIQGYSQEVRRQTSVSTVVWS